MSEVNFGERIRTIRKNAGCSQKEFCSVLDIPQSYGLALRYRKERSRFWNSRGGSVGGV